MNAQQNLVPPVKMEVPAFDDITVNFGADEKDYLTREQLGDWYGLYGGNSRTPYHKCAEGLFSNGGKLADYGLSIKADLDVRMVMKAIGALMRSFAPKHEVKIGTLAVALSNWCDLSSKSQS